MIRLASPTISTSSALANVERDIARGLNGLEIKGISGASSGIVVNNDR